MCFKDDDKANSKKIRAAGFCVLPLSGCFCNMEILCPKNKSLKVKTVLKFSVLLY